MNFLDSSFVSAKSNPEKITSLNNYSTVENRKYIPFQDSPNKAIVD